MNKYRVNYKNHDCKPAHFNLFAEDADTAKEVFENHMNIKAESVELLRAATDFEMTKINEARKI